MARNASEPGESGAPCFTSNGAASRLKSQLPERARQIDELLCTLGGPFDPLPTVLVCGPRATGKSSIVREALSLLGRPHAWASMAQGSNQFVMEGILAQLAHACQRKSDGTTPSEGSDEEQVDWRRESTSIGKFLEALPRAILGGAELPLTEREPISEEDSREGSEAAPLSPSNPDATEITVEVSQGLTAPGSPRHFRPISALDSKAKSRKELFPRGLPGQGHHPRRNELPERKAHSDAMGGVPSPIKSRLRRRQPAGPEAQAGDEACNSKLGAEPQRPQSGDERGEEGEDTEPAGTQQEPSGAPAELGNAGSRMDKGGVGPEQESLPGKAGEEPGGRSGVQVAPPLRLRRQSVVHRIPTVYIVIDNVELAAAGSSEKGIDDGMALLRALVRVPEYTGLQNVAVILIGCVSGASLMWGLEVAAEPVAVLFPAYTEAELLAILERQRPGNKLYAAFLRQIGGLVIRMCRSLPELDAILEPLWGAYISADGRVPNERGGGAGSTEDPSLAARLFGNVQRRIPKHLADPVRAMLGQWEGDAWLPSAMSSGKEKELIDMPALAKFALLAAYICSRNPVSMDETLFADQHGPMRRKRTRKDSALTQEKKEREVREGQQMGPAPFSLRRWLDVCCSIVAADGGPWVCHPHAQPPSAGHSTVNHNALHAKHPAGEKGKGGGKRVGGGGGPACAWNEGEEGPEQKEGGLWGREDLLMQVATLVDAGLVGRSREDPLDLGAKYWCRSDADFVSKIAKSLNFPLKRYLLYG